MVRYNECREDYKMENEKKCNKYEGMFVFSDEQSFNEHIASCNDCQKEHQKYERVSQLIKEVAPVYLKREKQKKISAIKKLACCFVLFVGLTGGYTGYYMYDINSFQVETADESYINEMGLPIDEYGFLSL